MLLKRLTLRLLLYGANLIIWNLFNRWAGKAVGLAQLDCQGFRVNAYVTHVSKFFDTIIDTSLPYDMYDSCSK